MYMLSQCFISDFDPWQVLRFFPPASCTYSYTPGLLEKYIKMTNVMFLNIRKI
jgi:hypothetical protein